MPPSLVASIESGRRMPRTDQLLHLLAQVGLDLVPSAPQDQPTDRLLRWLGMSTGQRLYVTLGGTRQAHRDRTCAAWTELGTLAYDHVVSVPGPAAIGVWLPDHPAELPMKVTVHGLRNGWLRRPVDVRELTRLEVTSTVDAPDPTWVPAGILRLEDVRVPSPLALALGTASNSATRELLLVDRLLHGEGARDGSRRRRPPHRVSDVRREEALVMTTRAYGDRERPTPDARDRRDWRLGSVASLRQWLDLHRYPQGGPRLSRPDPGPGPDPEQDPDVDESMPGWPDS